MPTREPIPKGLAADILVACRRRCCICFALTHNAAVKKGQIAHLDHDPSNNSIENLVFLCLEHHDQYDSRTSQSKGLTIEEVKRYRVQLEEFTAWPLALPESDKAKAGSSFIWHQKRLDALVTIYEAFRAYLDFLRTALYIPGTARSLDPMWDFRRALEKNMVYLNESLQRDIQRLSGELLEFWNWAHTQRRPGGIDDADPVQKRLDFEIPGYLDKLRLVINSYMEDDNPGLWKLWLRCQCVTVGYAPDTWENYKLEGGTTRSPDWNKAKKALKEMQVGDFIIAALPGRRIGRLGQVVEKQLVKNGKDWWQPLIAPSSDDETSRMGRRILVRWDLEHGPDSLDQAVQLPEDFDIGWRGTLNRVWDKSAREFREIMANPANWVGLAGRFGYESALSDYIALYPHRLEDGLRPHPSKKVRQNMLRVREKVCADGSRLDVLLLDKDDKPVIVECKQDSPTVQDIGQLRHYIWQLKKDLRMDARGILVHGGARKLHSKVWEVSRKSPRVVVFQYKLDVDFEPSC